ncbi:MAG: hypothetical protein QM741_16815 [Rudaea sp.]|uniref:hypothetical protein n=1 Tax=Rudaea sp. TaxID=2136325 RepID=UPI0039E47883
MPGAASTARIRLLWAGFAFLYLLIALWIALAAPPAIGDEKVHYAQIDLFDHGVFRVYTTLLTTLPGYHALVAGLLWLFDQRTLTAARLLSAVFGLLAIAAFHLLRKGASGRASHAATFQFAFLPILFPYCFLVYTDVLSLALVLAAGAATLRARHRTSAVLMLLAMAIRQVNVIWLPLYMGMAIRRTDLAFAPRRHGRRMMLLLSPYLVDIGIFLAYWVWNGSISMSKEQVAMHPDFALHAGNVYFALFLCGILFPLHVAVGLKPAVVAMVERKWLALLVIAAFALYWWSFHNDHPFNQATIPLWLHNYVVQRCADSIVCKAALGLIAVAALCGLAGTRLDSIGRPVFYGLSALALAAFWMVEPRYALIPLSLWLAFRERRGTQIEGPTTALWIGFAGCVCFGAFSGTFLP